MAGSTEDLYTTEDLACAAKDWPAGEVAEAFSRYRAAVDAGDRATMAAMLSEDGRGGNATFGVFPDRESWLRFTEERWPESVPNRSVWQVIEGGRVVDKWREELPGTRPDGGRYVYFGIAELIYTGGGKFRLIYSIPDLFGLTTLYARWKADGQHEIHGEVYPGLL